MKEKALSVREIQQGDIKKISHYWLTATPAYLQSMGVDLDKMPGEEQWHSMLEAQLHQPYHQKKSYCTIWQLDGNPIGHCNVNNIIFGEEAYMHLHIWHAPERKLGLGPAFIKMSVPYFFNNLQLQTIFCEPYALNPAPNKALIKAGFSFVKNHTTTPGSLNFEQLVSRWQMSRDAYAQLNP
jgi:RimJ/RimL family protein N-acetyltransferase